MNDSATNNIQSQPDGERVQIDRHDQLQGWAKKFDATPAQIKEAVEAVGDRADRVEMHLKGSRSSTNADREAASDASIGPQDRGDDARRS